MEEVAAHRARFRLYTLLTTQGMQSDPRNIYLKPKNVAEVSQSSMDILLRVGQISQ